jgi:hypothetical protein
MHGTVKRSAIQGLSQKRSVRAVVFDYGNVLCRTVNDLLRIAKLDRVLDIEPDEASALSSFGQTPGASKAAG